MKKLICKIFGHKKIYLEAMYAGEVDGWFCDRCDFKHIERQY